MREISVTGTSFIARAILLLDVLYIKTPSEWKGMLLPLHPIFLWRYYEVFKTLQKEKGKFDKDDAKALTEVLNNLPQIMNFLVANRLVIGNNEDKTLPCSGNIEMLPTFENRTNRYLGDDGTQAIGEILSRWIGFAPYSKNEIRICSVDAPDLLGNIRALKHFMDSSDCQKIVYDVYLTRKQNGNTELSKLDYSGKDYEIGEFIKKNKISISVKNVNSAEEVKEQLREKPVHIAFYFDQSAYEINFGPSNPNLYVNPLVITYDYDFDEIEHRGSIYASSDMDSGLIGDYQKLMRYADVVTNDMNPRTTYNSNSNTKAVVSTLEEGLTQWLVVADRDTNNYEPKNAIPIGEMQFDKRMVNAWASKNSRIIKQYSSLLRGYNLFPSQERLIAILQNFGHIASNGLISIPKFGADAQAVENKKKGLIGTLFAAAWYTKQHTKMKQDSMVASLDNEKARRWLQDFRFGNERADLVGLWYEEDNNILHIEPIEVKTRDEAFEATITKVNEERNEITGHAADQIAVTVEKLRAIFSGDENLADMFNSARREVLKYQIVSECFRSVHDFAWQKKWYKILKQAFSNDKTRLLKVEVSGVLLHIKLSVTTDGEHTMCVNPNFDDCPIEFRQLSSKNIQKEVLEIKEKVSETEGKEPDTENNHEKNYEYDTGHSDQQTNNKAAETTDSKLTIEDQESIEKVHTTNISKSDVSEEEISTLVKYFKRACDDYHVMLKSCNDEDTVIGPSVIRLKFTLGRGQALSGMESHLEDIGREMRRTGIIIQRIPNSDELFLDIPRLTRENVLFKDVLSLLPKITSPEQLFFPLGRTPNGKDLIKNLGEIPHMLVGGSTGSGKSVFLFTMLASFLLTHPKKEELGLILSSSKLEDFIHFEGLPHLLTGKIISKAEEATQVIQELIFNESEHRGELLAKARVANITEYNKKEKVKLAPIVVVIDEFADLADQLDSKKDQSAFYKPVQRIAQTGRSRGIHLVVCTQRPEAKLVPPSTKAQLNGRVGLRVNDGISSRMIIDSPDAQFLQKHGDMIYKNGDVRERAQGYLITIEELDEIVKKVIDMNGKVRRGKL